VAASIGGVRGDNLIFPDGLGKPAALFFLELVQDDRLALS